MMHSKRPMTACSKKKQPYWTPLKLKSSLEHRPKLLSPLTDELSDIRYSCTNKYNFTFKHMVGKGGFGRVWKVQQKRSKRVFALKEMLKLRIVSKRSVHSVMNERRILGELSHSSLVNMQYAFQDREHLYLVLDLMPGGDLRYHLARRRRFTQDETQFIVACIVTGLDFLHRNGVIHRDIKPENLVLNEHGYVKITDFGVARAVSSDNAKDTSGTPGYMAPEVITRQHHGAAVDYFAVGVIAYEFMMGRRPYTGRNRQEVRDHILSKQVQIRTGETPEGWSGEAVDFVNRMIQRKPTMRLGAQGLNEIKKHPWFWDFPWGQLAQGTLRAPFIPREEDNFDSRVSSAWDDDIDTSMSLSSVQKLFEGYSYESKRSVVPTLYSSILSLKCNS